MSTIDDLMNLDPLDLTKDNSALDAIIAHYRNKRADAEAGVKAKKEVGPKKSLADLVGGMVQPKQLDLPKMRRL